MSKARDERSTSTPRGALLTLLAVLAAAALAMMLLTSCGGDELMTEQAAQTHARDVCRDAIQQKLKAPSTAVFTGETVTVESADAQTVGLRIRGLVEAQTPAGGMVGHDFECTALAQRTGDKTVQAWVQHLTPRT